MQQCANCGHQNRAGIVFCENCGASLIGKVPLDTKSLDSSTEEEKAHLGIDSKVLTDVKVQGITTFEEGASLRLDIQGSTDPIMFKPKAETIFGRRDPATGAMPDVDLTPFAGYRMGVSRRHAAIRAGENQTLDLWDLGSSNGTFLNEERLNPHRPYRLRDGDEIRLGSMGIRIYFQRDEKPTARPDTTDQPTDQAVAPQAPADLGPATGVETRAVESLTESEAALNTANEQAPAAQASSSESKPAPALKATPSEPKQAPTAEESPSESKPAPAMKAAPSEPKQAPAAKASSSQAKPAPEVQTPTSETGPKTPDISPGPTPDKPRS